MIVDISTAYPTALRLLHSPQTCKVLGIDPKLSSAIEVWVCEESSRAIAGRIIDLE